MPIKIALPKGRLLKETATLLDKAGWGLSGYSEQARFYHLRPQTFPQISAKVFHEKDIPVQVAVGNYDLGICGLDWVEELLVRYPSSALVKVKELGYGANSLYVAASKSVGLVSVEELKARPDVVRLAGEYPNLAESFAIRLRLRRFSVFPLWGAAEVYPPESADLALVSVRSEAELANCGLVPVSRVLDAGACLIANASSWVGKDLSAVLASLEGSRFTAVEVQPAVVPAPETSKQRPSSGTAGEAVWLAVPDGHQQPSALELLSKAGIKVGNDMSGRRPAVNLDGVRVKVIRPQDMPLQVANGNFDLAITGRDWLCEHLYQFPSSPVRELLGLKLGKVRIVAVVSQDLPVADTADLKRLIAEQTVPFRVASEYVNIADKYARDNRLGHYLVIPTWGASEAFVPEDADLLIENTETGRTIARHNLKIIDTLFESTACLIGRIDGLSPAKSKRCQSIVRALRGAVEGI